MKYFFQSSNVEYYDKALVDFDAGSVKPIYINAITENLKSGIIYNSKTQKTKIFNLRRPDCEIQAIELEQIFDGMTDRQKSYPLNEYLMYLLFVFFITEYIIAMFLVNPR